MSSIILYFDLNFTTGIKIIYTLNDLILAPFDYHLQWKVANFS